MPDGAYTADALFDEGDIGFDHDEANAVLDIRARFDALDTEAKAKLAEALLSVDATKAASELILASLEADTSQRAGKCTYCHESIGDKPSYARQLVWVTPGTNKVVHREELEEQAHDYCVERVKEGGSTEAPIF